MKAQKTPRLRLATTFVLLAATISALAVLPPKYEELPNLDRRTAVEPARVAPERLAASATLSAKLPDAIVEYDELGRLKWVRSRQGFLTGASGQGRGVSAQTRALFAIDEPYAATKAFLREHSELFGFGPAVLADARVTREFTGTHNGLTTVVWQQELDNIAVFEAVFISHTTKPGELVNLTSQFIPNPTLAAEEHRGWTVAGNAPPITAQQAVALAASNLGEELDVANVNPLESIANDARRKQRFSAAPLAGSAETQFVWLPMNQDTMRLCWDVMLTSRARGEMYRLLVDAETGEVQVRRRLTEYISDATYRIFLSDSPSPFSPGCPTLCTTQPPVNPPVLVTLSALDTNASPSGWIDDGVNETRGNNVDAHTDRNADNSPDLPRPQGSPFRIFDFPLDLTQSPSTYTNAAVTDLFYWCNRIHDQLYLLGFTEAAGNFQNNNFGRGGFGNDALQADAQDGSGTDNANMSTPSDGSPPRMQMYLFVGPNPDRDGDFDHEIVTHEYIHGLSNRRVGGGVGLSALQSRGMGEGWSDWYALTLLSEDTDDLNGVYAKGGYATYLLSGFTTNYYFGIRRYPYSRDMTKNPLTFKDIDANQASAHTGIPRSSIIGNSATEVHNQGEVWCVTLWDARANLVAKYGHAVGNQLILQLVTDGMNFSPADPNFLQARDGILQADVVNNGGANLTELWAAFAKRGMGYSATSPSSSTTVGLVEAYDQPDNLTILPPALSASGQTGGPFSPNPTAFALTNVGSTNLSWSLMNTSVWLNVAPSSGTLLPGGPGATVSVTVTPQANSLPLGTYISTIRFTNLTSGVVQSCPFRLSVVGRSMNDDFDPTIDLSQWSLFGGAVGSTVMANNYGGFISSPYSLWFGDSGSRFARTIPINTSGGGGIAFSIRLAYGSSSTWETADFLPDEGVVLESSTNGGLSWTILGSYDTTNYYNWVTVTSSIPAAARSDSTFFQWRQKSHSGSGFDHWAIDSVSVDAVPSTVLTLALPAAATEGDAPTNGIVTASPTPTNNLVVTLTSGDVSEITVPPSVTILAGQSNATFAVSIVDDAELDGSRIASVTATATNYLAANASIAVLDDETATLSVSVPGSVTEGGAALPGTITVSAPPTANITVSLSSSDTSEIQVPSSITLLAGQTSAGFSVTIVNDTQIDGDQSATVTAHVLNWTDGVGTITVRDNEPTNLVVTLPASAREGSGTLSGAGSVRIGGTLSANLVVTLLSSDTTELTVPASATILAGQTVGSFNLAVVDDPDIDSSQTVTVTASATGFANGSTNMVITDDESPPEPFNPQPAHLAANVIQTSDLGWSSGAMPGEVITNDVYFGTTPTPGPAELLGTTTSANWVLPTLWPQTTYYWRIVARKTGVTPGPVWQFTTRGVDHFVWGTIPSPQFVAEPFTATLTAKDAFETTVSNFTGNVSLSGSGSGGQVTNVILGNLVPSFTSSGQYTLGYSFTPNTNLSVTHVRSYSGAKVSIWTDGGLLLASRTVSGPSGTWTDTPLASPLTLNAGTRYRVAIYTGVSGSYAWREDASSNFSHGIINQSYEASGDTFPTLTDSVRWWFVDLRYTVEGSQGVPISPTNVSAFANGTWSGPITALAPTTNLVLRADDGAGHIGLSASTVVGLHNDLAVSTTDSPDPVSLGGNVTYTISVTNIGPNSATGVLVTNILSPAVSLVSASSSQGTVTTNGQVLIFNLNTLTGDASATISIVATATNVGTLTNRVFAARVEPDPFVANNSAVNLTAVQTPTVSIADASLFEGNSGTKTALFTVSISPIPAFPASVNFATASGSAVAPADFINTNGVLTFAPGETNKTVSVRIVGDIFYEPDETFTVNLSGAMNVTLADGVAIGTILNDDSMPGLSISDVTLVEGNVGRTNAVFTISLSAPSGSPVSLNFNTTDGNAYNGTDYTYTNGYIWFPAGTTSTNIAVSITGDLQIENDEVFYADIYSASGALLFKREGYALILNDDGLPGNIDHFAWSPIASPQYVGQPLNVTINALDAFNYPAVNFSGPANLSVAGGPGTTNVLGTDTSSSSYPIYTGSYAERTQVIYPASEVGPPGVIAALAIDVSGLPGITLSNWTVRLKHTPLTNYNSYVWESTDWTVVQTTNLSISANGWLVLPFNTPFLFDGTNSLMVDFSFYNTTTYGSGSCRTTPQSYTRTLYYYTSGYGSPLTWSGSSPSPYTSGYTPNLLLVRGGELTTLQPGLTGVFTNGVWSGVLTALSPATNIVLSVDDGFGHVGISSAFAVKLINDIGIGIVDSPDPVAVGANLTYSVSVTNTGPAGATGVVVTNQLPASVTLVSVAPSQGSYTNFGQTIVCNLGAINGTNQANVTIVVTPGATGSITNIATVSRVGVDNYPVNNSATNSTLVTTPALSVNDVTIKEPNVVTTNLVFNVSLSVATPLTVTVNYATANGTALAGSDYTATNGTLTFLPGQTNQPVYVAVLDDSAFEVVETFSLGLTSPVNATMAKPVGTASIVDNEGPPDFQIFNLLTTNSKVVDHDVYTSDDRGGVAISTTHAFVTGDGATARFAAGDLTGGASLGIIRDSLCTDLRTETVYMLGNGSSPITSSGGTVSSLIELNATGTPTGIVIPLSQSFSMPSSANGIFSGYGRIVVHNGTRVYDIYVPTGVVTDRGAMARPNMYSSESWSSWGVAEYFGGYLYLGYRESSSERIVRARVPDGSVTVIATFSSLGDMASFVVSPSRNRWYFHYESGSQFGSYSEALGYADANFITTSAPTIFTQPLNQLVPLAGTGAFSVGAAGSMPLTYQWRKNGTNLLNGGQISGATSNVLTVANVQTNDAGFYSVAITNAFGWAVSTNATLTPDIPLPPAVPFNPNPTNLATGVSVRTSLSWNTSTAAESEQAVNGTYGVIDTTGYDSAALSYLQGMPGLSGTSISWATINGSSGSSLFAAYDVIYFAVNADSTDYQLLSSAVSNGSPLERYVDLGGALVLNLAGNAGSQASIGPGGLGYNSGGHEAASIMSPTHPFITGTGYGGTPLTTAMFANWSSTDHGTLTGLPGGATELLRNTDGTSMVEYTWGAGRVIASTLTFGWSGSTVRFGPPFTNELLYAASLNAAAPARYQVYFGTNPVSLNLIATNLLQTTCNPGTLQFNTTYYWQVVATNIVGSVTGAVWRFTTAFDEVHFASDTAVVSENVGTATITVLRENPAGGALSIQYTTTNGTATAGVDYTPVSGTLNFPAGVLSTNFQIAILNDGLSEGSETVEMQLWLTSTNVLLSSPSNALLTIVDDDAIQVSVFADSSYVDVTTTTDGELTNVVASLLLKGCQVRTFTGITPTAFSNALIGASILYIPDLEIGDLGVALSAASKSVISNFVTGGGRLIINGESASRDETFLNQVFGFTIASASSSLSSALSGAATGTAFAGGPSSLPENNGTYEWLRSSLPAGSLSIYQDGSGLYTTVALIPRGAGRIAFLAYDWYDAAPRGSQDGGWDDVLRRALLEVSAPWLPIITNQPGNQTVSVGQNAGFAVGVSGAAPLRYQWRKGGTPLANQTNATLTLLNVQLTDAGTYNVTVTNVYGSAISSNVLLAVLAPPQLKFLEPDLVSGALRLRVTTVDNSPIPPARASNIWVYASTDLGVPLSNWTAIATTPVLTNGMLVFSGINSSNPPSRFFRAIEGSWNVRPLLLHSPQRSGSTLMLRAGAPDGSPVTPMRAAKVRFYASTNVALPFVSWEPVIGTPALSNGVLSVSVPTGANTPALYFRTMETP